MEKCKRILCVLLAVLLVAGLLPTAVTAAGSVTVYVNAASGADSNTGLSEDNAVATLEAAYEKLIAASPDSGKIVFLDTLTMDLSDVLTLPEHSFPVTLTGKTGADGFEINNTINFSGDTTLENLTITLTKASNSYFLCGGGHKFVIGQNVTATPYISGSTTYRLGLIGTYRLSGTQQVDMTVKSGTWRAVYGLYGQAVSGDITMDIQGGTISNLSPAYNNDVAGNVQLTVSNATVTNIYLASYNTLDSAKGTAKGDVDLTLGSGAKVTNVYCGPSGKFCVDGTVSVILDGITDPITTLSGTGKAAGTGTIGASRLVLRSGTLANLPVSFDSIELAPTAGKTLSLGYSGSLSADSFTGGGNLTLGADTALEITGPVTGKTACSVSGTVSDSLVYITAPSDTAADAFAFENTGITLKSAFTKQWSAAAGSAASITDTAGTRYYEDLASAVAAYTNGYIALWADTKEAVTVGKEIYLDMNGFDAAVTLTAGGKLHGLDSTTNDYAIGSTPCGVLTVTGGAAEFETGLTWGDEQYRYLALEEQGGYTFHRFALETKKGLRPYNSSYGVALYYQPYFYTDEAVAAVINTGADSAYGVYVTPDSGGTPIYASIRGAGGVFDAATDNSLYRVAVPELIPSNAQLDSGEKTTQAAINNSQNVVIDLNGKDITSSGRVALIQGSASLTVTDTSSETAANQGIVKTTNTTLNDDIKGGGVIYVHTGELIVYGGNFDGTSITSQSTNSADYCGAVLHVLSNGTAQILGGTMTGGFSWRGGTIYNQGQLTIGGNAVINGGSSSNMGAAIYNESSVTLEGNSILNCGTSTAGGAYGVIGGNITITGNATVNRNSSSRVVMSLNTLTKDVTISGNATINGQIQVTNSSSYYRSKLVIKDTPTFIIDAANPVLYFVAWNNDAQKNALDLSGLTGGSGLTIRLPSSARTGVFGTGAKSLLTTGGVVRWVKSNDSAYMITLNADNKLEMVETAVIPEALSATFVGDSITNGQGATTGNRYWELLEKQGSLEQVFGMGVNGSTYSTQSEFGLEKEPLTTRYDQIPDTDLIFIFLGTNDFGRNTPMGAITDTEDVSFYGAMNLCLTLQDYITAIKAVAQEHELEVIDMNTLTADIFVEANRATLMSDTVHPNDAGHVYLANAIKSWMDANNS